MENPSSLEDIETGDIILTPLNVRPGETYYIPGNVKDDIYPILINDSRALVQVCTTSSHKRFVVARPLEPVYSYVEWQMVSLGVKMLVVLMVYMLVAILAVYWLFRPVRKLAVSINARSDNDFEPLQAPVPSELDVLLEALNKLFVRTANSIENERYFLANAAHELKSPLTALSLMDQTFPRDDLSEEAKERLENLFKALRKQKALTLDLLDLARIRNKNEKLQVTTFNVAKFLLEILEGENGIGGISSLADEKSQEYAVDCEADLCISSCPQLLRRIVSNLTSNAIKYTPAGGSFTLAAKKTGTGVEFIVSDDGAGIPENELEKVLEPFYRVGGDMAKIPGTGLGLAIVNAACERLGATITLQNRSPHGLEAIVRLGPEVLLPQNLSVEK